jgi:hypothetical protein
VPIGISSVEIMRCLTKFLDGCKMGLGPFTWGAEYRQAQGRKEHEKWL